MSTDLLRTTPTIHLVPTIPTTYNSALATVTMAEVYILEDIIVVVTGAITVGTCDITETVTIHLDTAATIS